MPKYDAIFVMGPQGSGKGTQAKMLAEKLGFFHWEMGGVLRQERDHRFADGQTVGGIIDSGTLLPDDKLLEVFKKRMGQIPAGQGVIFDGIPRRIGQAQFLINWLHSQGKQNLVTIFLFLPREESLKRLSLRAQIENRADDTLEAMESRLREHNQATVPILGYMKENTKFIELDGQPSIPEVTKEVERALGMNLSR